MQTKTSSTTARTQVVTHIPAPLIRMQAAFFVLLLLIVAGPLGTRAQCTINTGNTISGFTPAGPDTVTQGLPYSLTEQLYVPATYQGFAIDSFVIDSIRNLPTGIAYVINPVSGVIHGGGRGAICFSGITHDTDGVYRLKFYGNAVTALGPVPLSNVSGFSLTFIVVDTLGRNCDSLYHISAQIFNTNTFDTVHQVINCGSSVGLAAQTSGNSTDLDYAWSTGDTGIHAVEITATAGLYTLTVTNSYGCSATATTTVSYSGGVSNTVNFSLPASPTCAGSPLTFTNLTTDTAGWTAQWFVDGNHIILPYNFTQGSHQIELIMDSGVCQFFRTKNFIVQYPEISNLSMTFSGQDTVVFGGPLICNGGSVNLGTDSSYSHYAWSTGVSSANITVHNSGDYFVTVTDINGCTALTDRLVTVDSPVVYITTTTSATSKCKGDPHILTAQVTNYYGWILYPYHWSNGVNAYSDTVSPLATTTYYVTFTDQIGCTAKADTTITVLANQRPVVNAGTNQTLPGCGIDTLGGNPTATGGTLPYVYHWSPYNGLSYTGSPNPTVNNIYTPTTYTLVVTDSIGCTDTGRVTITPVLTAPITPPVVTKNGCELSFPQDSGFTNQWYHSGRPVAGATATSYAEDSSGYWSVVITPTAYPLCHVSSNYINIYPYSGQQICIVTLDSTATYNMVVWDNTAGEGISKFRIYKQSDSTSQFVLLGEQAVSMFSTFIDSTSNPSQYSASYKISIVDSCGNESYLSQQHTTILLSSNQGINHTVNLNWNAYQGFTYSNFEIWRSANGGPMTLLTTVANSTLAYVDNNPPAQAYYQIQVINPNGCNPSRSAFDYSTVKSNIVNGGNPAAIPGVNETSFDFSLFPNPSTGLVHASIMSACTGPATLRITDMLGRLLQAQRFQISAGKNAANVYIPVAGTYFVELL